MLQGSNRGIMEDLFSFLFPLLLILVDCLDHCCVKMSPMTKMASLPMMMG